MSINFTSEDAEYVSDEDVEASAILWERLLDMNQNWLSKLRSWLLCPWGFHWGAAGKHARYMVRAATFNHSHKPLDQWARYVCHDCIRQWYYDPEHRRWWRVV